MTARLAIVAVVVGSLTLAGPAAARLVPSKGKPYGVLGQAGTVAVSPDGKNVYVAAVDTGAVTIFSRARNGKLRRLRGANGCITRRRSRSRCRVDRSVASAFDMVVSPDGRNVYAGGDSKLVTFARNTRVGSLRRVGPALAEGDSPTVSADGKYVYAGSTTYVRNPATGALRSGPATTLSLAFPSPVDEKLALSPDRRFGYLMQTTQTANTAVLSLSRDPATGALTQLEGGCLLAKPELPGCGSTGWTGTSQPADFPNLTYQGADIVVTPNGSTVVAVINEGEEGAERSVAGLGILSRDPAAGLLTPSPPRLQSGDLTDNANGFALAPDGRTAILASDMLPDIRVLDLGSPEQVRTSQCFVPDRLRGCTQLRRLDFPAGVAVSPNGRSVYVANASDLLAFAKR
ncbi:MAG: hypothetical protein H0T15_00760 [Thermoleophilaceae bacterium]|nr:hypothetical protein [Thermoleophilaceae bacterium]